MNNFSYTIEQIGEWCNAKFIGSSYKEVIQHIIIDSRKVKEVKNHLFIAIKGPNHNGHNYIKDLYEKGCKNFLISDTSFDIKAFSKGNFLIAKNSLTAYQTIARHHRLQFKIPIIGITGSNGKTVIKEWLSSCLQEKYNICKSPNSYNSQVGVPISLMGLHSSNDIGVFEIGISKKKEMSRLEEIVQPTLGIFTNIGQAHSQNFTSIEEKIEEKSQLFNRVEKLIYCEDHEKINLAISQKNIPEKISWSKQNKGAFLFVNKLIVNGEKTTLHLSHKKSEKTFATPFKDHASIDNSLHLICALLTMRFSDQEIQEKLNKLESLEMRLELKEGKGGSLIINDSYSSDFDSLKIALDFLDQQSGNLKKVVILSDLDETGLSDKDLFSKLKNLLNNYNVKDIIGVGSSFSKFETMFANCISYKSTNEFLKNYQNIRLEKSAILLKGARRFKFEKIAEILEQKVHETLLEVNLNAIAENFHFFRSFLKKETKIMVMVKAFSYGNGSYEIAHHLEYHNADYLAVACVDEGIALRKKGIRSKIMVLNPNNSQFNHLIEYCLEPEIYCLNQLKELQNTLNKLNLRNYPIHLKMDTGMNRLGFDKNNIDGVIDWINLHPEIKIASVFSHLASSENLKDKKFTLSQIDLFSEIYSRIKSKIKYQFLKHILNSTGILNYPEAEFDMVRLGIGLYGIGNPLLKNCSSLKSTIIQIKDVKKGDSIGYNRTYYAEKLTRIAIISIGYADGLNRGLSNSGHVYIQEEKVKIIGNICMDMCMVDLGDINAKEGDEVIIWNHQDHILDMAKTLNTIPYEVLTSISQRVKRVFIHE